MSKNEISLDGGEVQVIKALGVTGGEISGKELVELLPDLVESELIETLKGMIMMGYVIADRQAFYDVESLEITKFHVNSGYARDLKEAMDPRRDKPKSKRVRRE